MTYVGPQTPRRTRRRSPAQATLGRLNRTGAVAMVTLFSAHSLPEHRKTVPLSRTLDGRREMETEGGDKSGRGMAYLMHTSSKFAVIYPPFILSANSHLFLHLSAELCFSLSLSCG